MAAATTLLAMVTVHPAAELEQVLDGGVTAAGMLAALVEQCAAAGGLRTQAEGTWAETVLDLSLDAWVAARRSSRVPRRVILPARPGPIPMYRLRTVM